MAHTSLEDSRHSIRVCSFIHSALHLKLQARWSCLSRAPFVFCLYAWHQHQKVRGSLRAGLMVTRHEVLQAVGPRVQATGGHCLALHSSTTVTTSHTGLFKSKLSEIKCRAPHSHQPHRKCSLVTSCWRLTCWTEQTRYTPNITENSTGRC